jgi:microsomal dipeptidase-like Zn-dependent dipeptidase
MLFSPLDRAAKHSLRRTCGAVAIGATLLLSAPAAHAQVHVFGSGYGESFESGTSVAAMGWSMYPNNAANAFHNQPTFDENVSVDRIRPPGSQTSVGWQSSALGGDFWQTPYPINKDGNWWIGTYENRPNSSAKWGQTQGDGPQGVLYSPVFMIGGSNPAILSFLIGGGGDSSTEKVELVTLPPETSTGAEDFYYYLCLSTASTSKEVFDNMGCGNPAYGIPWQTVSVQDAGWRIAGSPPPPFHPALATGQYTEQLTPVYWDTSGSGTTAIPVRLRITDLSSGGWGHINVDGIRQFSGLNSYMAQYRSQQPLWGFADLHTHWMASLAYGATEDTNGYPLDTVNSMLWGAPYDQGGVSSALGVCDNAHEGSPIRGGPQVHRTQPSITTALTTLDGNGLLSNSGCSLADCWHPHFGADANGHFNRDMQRPYMDVIHQQMYWEWVRRSWQAGLRLMVVDALNDVALEAPFGDAEPVVYPNGNGSVSWPGTDDLVTINRQTRALKFMVQQPEIAAFAEIAYNPAEARDIIQRGKLALIMGAEVDGLGSLRGFFGDATDEVAYLQSIGVRKLNPIHLVDNANGGAAAYSDLLNSANDILNLAGGGLNGGGDNSGGNCYRSDDPTIPAWMANPPLAEGEVRCSGAWREELTACGGAGPGNPQDSNNGCYRPTAYQNVVDGCVNGEEGDGFCSTFIFGAQPDPHYGGYWQIMPTNYFRLEESWQSLIGGFYTNKAPGLANLATNVAEQIGIPTAGGWIDYGVHGFKNQLGLSTQGTNYIAAMMGYSLIVDIDHMSEAAYQQVIGKTAGNGSADTQGMIWTAGCSDDYTANTCRQTAYPVVASHTGFRKLAYPVDWSRVGNGYQTQVMGGAANERSKTPEDVARIISSGGIIGIGTGYGAVEGVSGAPIPNDCAGSVKSWAQGYYYLLQQIEAANIILSPSQGWLPSGWNRGIALGTDFNGFQAELGPAYLRPGSNATSSPQCPARYDDPGLRGTQSSTPSWWNEASLQNSYWQNGVIYDDSPTAECSRGPAPFCKSLNDNQPALARLRIAGYWDPAASYDLNYDGLANYGMLPDMIQAMVNAGDSSPVNRAQVQSDLRNLYRSAEDFVEMWEQAISACHARAGTGCLSNQTVSQNGRLVSPWDDPWDVQHGATPDVWSRSN